FQAEDGIRDFHVTGVQTCALPILFGTLQAPGRPIGTQLLILPGTHSKWVQVRRDEVDRFATAVTGELYASLRRYGSLAAFVDERSEERRVGKEWTGRGCA